MDGSTFDSKPVRVGPVLYFADEMVSRWVGARLPQPWTYSPDMRALGVMVDGRLAAGVIYHTFNGANVVCEIAAVPGSRWASRTSLYHLFAYPFETLGCGRITVLVERRNRASVKLVLSMGFAPEATLRGSAPDGGDMIVFAMHRHECQWIGAADGQEFEGARGA